MAEPVLIVCPQCGAQVEVKDPASLVLALHMNSECDVSGLLVHHDGGGE